MEIDGEQIVTYRGKNINDMTRQELIDALQTIGRRYNRLLQERQFDHEYARNGLGPW